MKASSTPSLLQTPPSSCRWFILDVMRKGDKDRPFRRGRPRNEGVALMIDVDPDIFCTADIRPRSQSCWVGLGKHKDLDSAWDYAEQLTASRH